MTFELEISTMHKDKSECFEMLARMNIHCNCIVICQCDKNEYYEEYIGNQRIRIIFTTERGLSKSRNMALRYCNADILGIADDDLIYYSNFEKFILDAYELNKNASAICFNMDSYDAVYSDKNYKCNFLNLFSFVSMMCTFNVKDIKNNNLLFNEYFGTGSNFFQSGEENILLSDLYRKGKLIYYDANKILKRPESESSWFHGIDRDFIETRGAVIYAMRPSFSNILIFLFGIKKIKKFKPFNIFQILHFLYEGKRKYIKIKVKEGGVK